MSLLETIFTNLICGFISALFFVYFILWLYKPRIKIGELIATREDTFDQVGQKLYAFKILNLSKFKAFDVTLQLYEVVSIPGDGNRTINRYKELTLKTNKFTYLARHRSQRFNPTYCDHALIFRTYEDLKSVLATESKSLVLEITLRHGLTGITGVHTQRFVGRHCIKEGTHKTGNSFDVIPV